MKVLPDDNLLAIATRVADETVDPETIKAAGSLTFATQLVNPPGVIDRVPANNRRTSTLAPASAK